MNNIREDASGTRVGTGRSGRHVPDSMSVWSRCAHVAIAVALMYWGLQGAGASDLLIVGARGGKVLGTLHLRGFSLWLMLVAVVCGSAMLLSAVVSHYDRRDNEPTYRAFRIASGTVAGICFALSLIWYATHAI